MLLQFFRDMKEKVLSKMREWLSGCTPTCDPIPMPFYNEWEVQVDGKMVRIIASNRLIAYIKANIKYPDAKRIRILKKIDWRLHDVP